MKIRRVLHESYPHPGYTPGSRAGPYSEGAQPPGDRVRRLP